MPDLKMTLAFEAEAKLRPLAESVRKLTAQLAHLRHRLETERGNVGKREADLESLKAAASSYLAENTFPTFKVRLKRATEILAAARESVVLFETDLIPRTEKGLQEAREKLEQVFAALVLAARADCEAEMAAALTVVVATHDDFLAAIREVGKTYGTAYHGKPPVVYSSRLAEVKHTPTGRWWLTFTAAPPAPAAPAPAAAVPAQPGRAESTPTPEVGESVKADAPLPPEAPVVPLGVAAEHPTEAAPLGARARVLLRFTGDAGDVAPTPLAPDTQAADLRVALDALNADADLDADEEADEADAEAEAPPADG
jgi:hypothetical protein